MDPNLFHVDFERMAEVLVTMIVLSFFLERALSLVFEHKYLSPFFTRTGIKELIAFGLAFLICNKWDLDAVSIIITTDHTSLLGMAITAGVIAGGSKASIKLFHDVMGVKNSTVLEQEQKRQREIKQEHTNQQ